MRKRKPTEILQCGVHFALCFDKHMAKRRWPKPGQYITDILRPEDREILKNLKSDDIANLRPDSLYLP